MNNTIPKLYRVRSKRNEIANVVSIALESQDEVELLGIKPGQFNMLYCFGIGEVPISLSDVSKSGEVLTHTIKAVGAVSRGLSKLKRGDTVGLRGPFGSFWPMEEAYGKDLIIIAGGIGLAPLRVLINQVIKKRAQFNEVVLLYGTRSRGDILFEKEYEYWRKYIRVEVTLDIAGDHWNGNVGTVISLLPNIKFDSTNCVSFICGPEVMMRFAIQKLLGCGVASDSIYLSMERNMKCALGHCGHCMFGPMFVCKDGPIFRYSKVESIFEIREY